MHPISSERYRQNVDAVVLFLEGRSEPLVDSLRARMKAAAGRLEFEEAARLRDQIIALERSLERQAIATTDPVDQDVFGLYREADRITIYALYVRGGRLAGGRAHHFASEFPDDELIASFVNQYYADENFVPKEVLVPYAAAEAEALGDVLSEAKGERVKVLVPQRGDKVELLKLAVKNAERSFGERSKSREEVEVVLERLMARLHLKRLPRRMECFDVSHQQGTSIVASQVASVDTELDPSRYRRYRLKTVTQNDDFASMHEILGRRLRRGLVVGDLPDLIVIDGGKGQLAAAQAAMKDSGVEGVDLVSLAKSHDLEVADRDLSSKRSPERVFLLGRKDPIVLSQTSPDPPPRRGPPLRHHLPAQAVSPPGPVVGARSHSRGGGGSANGPVGPLWLGHPHARGQHRGDRRGRGAGASRGRADPRVSAPAQDRRSRRRRRHRAGSLPRRRRRPARAHHHMTRGLRPLGKKRVSFREFSLRRPVAVTYTTGPSSQLLRGDETP